MKKILLGLISTAVSFSAMANVIGISNQPFMMKKHAITTEFNNYTSKDGGMGLTARYFRHLSERVSMDAGFGFTDGDRASRFILGSDIELIPDYGRQPRISVKGLLTSETFDGERLNSFGAAPTLSKGLAISGKEVFPFISLPMMVSLNEDSKKYETSTAIALGATGRLPIAGAESLIGNIEANMSLRNSYSSIVMGVSLPIE